MSNDVFRLAKGAVADRNGSDNHLTFNALANSKAKFDSENVFALLTAVYVIGA